jgi:hypothetical protein
MCTCINDSYECIYIMAVYGYEYIWIFMGHID